MCIPVSNLRGAFSLDSTTQRTSLLSPLSDYVKVDTDIDWLDVAGMYFDLFLEPCPQQRVGVLTARSLLSPIVFFRQFSAVYDGDIYAYVGNSKYLTEAHC
jgi:hypothetical protein